LEKGIVAAAPFAPDDTVRLTRLGFPLIANLSDSLTIPQTILTARNDFLEKTPETVKGFLDKILKIPQQELRADGRLK
jgi:ABC-type nitrate/sulfonate/bicarbonate transport system substrate-binding protein